MGERRPETQLATLHGCDPNLELFEACRSGDLAKVKKLVNKSNVNCRDATGRASTPLHFAAGKVPQRIVYLKSVEFYGRLKYRLWPKRCG